VIFRVALIFAIVGLCGLAMVAIGFRAALSAGAPSPPFSLLDAPRWWVFRARRPPEYFTYQHDAGPLTYRQMKRTRAAGWNESTILEVARARATLIKNGMGSGHPSAANPSSEIWVNDVVAAMTASAFTLFVDASCPLWASDPAHAQGLFDAFGERAIVIANAGLTLSEAVALDAEGRLDDGTLATLAALRAAPAA
jgi:hypothetical protein